MGVNKRNRVGFTALMSKDEEIFVHHVIAVSTWGFPFSNLDLRLLFKDYLERTSCEKKCFKTNIPGEDWVKSFLKHTSHSIGWRMYQKIRTLRAKHWKHDFIKYFDNLKEVLKDVPPANILIYDEANLPWNQEIDL